MRGRGVSALRMIWRRVPVPTLNIFLAKGAAVPVAYASSGAVLGPSSDYAAGAPLPAERDYHRRPFLREERLKWNKYINYFK